MLQQNHFLDKSSQITPLSNDKQYLNHNNRVWIPLKQWQTN